MWPDPASRVEAALTSISSDANRNFLSDELAETRSARGDRPRQPHPQGIGRGGSRDVSCCRAGSVMRIDPLPSSLPL